MTYLNSLSSPAKALVDEHAHDFIVPEKLPKGLPDLCTAAEREVVLAEHSELRNVEHARPAKGVVLAHIEEDGGYELSNYVDIGEGGRYSLRECGPSASNETIRVAMESKLEQGAPVIQIAVELVIGLRLLDRRNEGRPEAVPQEANGSLHTTLRETGLRDG